MTVGPPENASVTCASRLKSSMTTRSFHGMPWACAFLLAPAPSSTSSRGRIRYEAARYLMAQYAQSPPRRKAKRERVPSAMPMTVNQPSLLLRFWTNENIDR